jgi:hypothetical protein
MEIHHHVSRICHHVVRDACSKCYGNLIFKKRKLVPSYIPQLPVVQTGYCLIPHPTLTHMLTEMLEVTVLPCVDFAVPKGVNSLCWLYHPR